MTHAGATCPSPNTEAFRALFLLRGDIAFLNHGSFGACPKAVFDRYQRWQRELVHQPVEMLAQSRSFDTRMREAREALAGYLGVHRDSIVYHDNSTTALNQVARSLPLQPGDEIVGTDHEYGAVEKTWNFVAERRGATYVRTPIEVPLTTPERIVEQLWSRVTSRTRVISVCHVTSATALTFPVKAICARARAEQIITVIDGAHAPAYLDLDLADIDPDFYAGNCHKWLCAPKGTAFLYARPDRQALLEPLIVSWGWRSERASGSRFIEESEYRGTRDISASLTVPAAIAFQRAHAWDRVRASCQALADETATRITTLTGLAPLAPPTRDWTGQMRGLPLPACDVERVKRRLYDDHGVELPVYRWNDQPLLRISVQGYNTPNDLDRLLDALPRVLG